MDLDRMRVALLILSDVEADGPEYHEAFIRKGLM